MHHRENMKIKSQHGSTIIEVLVASFIFAAALFALVAFQTNLLRDRSLLDQKAYALSLAQDKMQSFRSYTSLTTTAGQFAYADITNGSSTTPNASAVYTMTWTVTDATDPTRKNVNITVTWTSSTGTAQTATDGGINLDSIIAGIDPTLTGKVSEGL